MSLQEYQRRRRFRGTPEPRGEVIRTTSKARRFVVQLHHASSRHYDFRLEVDGVLRSWAVPKGPSFRPGEKRLAVEVEDHPLSYASFEGEIPEGHYGAGHVAIFDDGRWTTDGDPAEALKRGKLDFVLQGRRLKGAWTLVRTGRASSKPHGCCSSAATNSPATSRRTICSQFVRHARSRPSEKRTAIAAAVE